MQSVDRPSGVTVHGAATVRAKPDQARIQFRVTRRERTPSEAFAVGTEAVAAVHQALRQHGVPDDAIARSELSLRSVAGHGQRPDGYQCESSFLVLYGELEDVQSLVVDVVAAGADQIDQLDFDVAAKDELHAEARRQAVAAARDKAELYADAAGVRLGEVLLIEDVVSQGYGSLVYAAAAESSGPREVLVPGAVVVSAEVVLGFAVDRG